MKKKHFCTQLWFGGSTKCDPINNTQWESHAAAWGQNILRYILTFLKNLQLHIYRVFFLALPFHPNFSAKKNVVQPTRISCTSEISWNRICLFVCLWFVAGCQDCCFKACDPFGSPFLWTVRETLLVTSDNNTAPPLTETALDAWQQTSREDNQASARKTRIR